jgi:AcrR family transcriptional regulator
VFVSRGFPTTDTLLNTRGRRSTPTRAGTPHRCSGSPWQNPAADQVVARDAEPTSSYDRVMSELSSASIAAAALAVVDANGVAGFTIRAVAERLGVTPMALYHHVADKAALAVLVVDAAMSERPMAASCGVWREDLLEMARWTRESTLAHPAVTHLRRTYRVWTPSMLRMVERWLSLWQQSGLPPKEAVLAANTSSMAINGLVAEETLYREMELPDQAMLAMLPSAQAVFKTRHDPHAVFELAVRSILDGLHAQLLKTKQLAAVPVTRRSAVRAAKRVPAQSKPKQRRNRS